MRTTSRPTAAASGLPPNVEPCSPGPQHAEHVTVADDGRHGHDAPAEGLAEQVQVGHHADEVAREGRPDPAEARLDLVGDEQHPAFGAELAQPRQEVGGRHDDARLALDRLDEHRDRVLVDRRGHRVGVAVRHGAEARRVGPEVGSRASGSSLNEMIVVVRPWKLPAITMMFAASGATPFTR